MKLSTEVWELIRAGFPGIWIESRETEEVIDELSQLALAHGLVLVRWNLEQGMRSIPPQEASLPEANDPLSAVRSLANLPSASTTILVLENLHRFLESPEMIQALLAQLHRGKQLGRHIIIVAPVVKLTQELERWFIVLEHSLPEQDQLLAIAEELAGTEFSVPLDQEREQLLNAASGLTGFEAESAFSLSLVRHGRFETDEVWQVKSQMLKKSGLLSLDRSVNGFETLGGLESLKAFCHRSLVQSTRGNASRPAQARGVLLLGVPGTGKSAFAKALGRETNRPVLCLDVGQLMGSLVGQTEQNIRAALKAADAMAPCILFVDEVEKALSGIASAGRGDSGVSTRLFGTLLTWLNDHPTDVYVVMTCNDIRQLPPEFSRAERFDAVVFLDLPQRCEKDAIWQLYRNQLGINASHVTPNDDQWTGAELQAC